MKITKYGHACVVLENRGAKLIIDPGGFTADFGELAGVVAVVVTHIHPDHFDPGHLGAIVAANPSVRVFATQEVADNWPSGKPIAVKAGDEHTVGSFKLRFYGDLHAEIHAMFPRQQNTGVLVNDTFYYPGDSFTVPDRPITILAMPAAAPWLKIGEAIDFLHAVKPTRFFRTHDAHLSARGLESVDQWFEKAAAAAPSQTSYTSLQPGESTEI